MTTLCQELKSIAIHMILFIKKKKIWAADMFDDIRLFSVLISINVNIGSMKLHITCFQHQANKELITST